MREYTLIVEPRANHMARFGAVAIQPYRVDFGPCGCQCFKNDAPVTWESLPKYMRAAANAGAVNLGLVK